MPTRNESIGSSFPKWEFKPKQSQIGKDGELSPKLGNLLIRVQCGSAHTIDLYNNTVDLFHKNLRYLIKQAGITRQQFVDIVNNSGLFKGMTIRTFSEPARTRRFFLKFNYFTTIAYLFDEPVHIMLTVDLKERALTQINNHEENEK